MNLNRAITEYRKRRAERILNRMDSARYDYDRPTDDYDWITIKGQHTPIDDGHIVGGIGGKFKGKAYTGSKMQQSKKRMQKLAEKAKSAVNGVRKVALRMTKAAVRIAGAKKIWEIKKAFQEELGIITGEDMNDWASNEIDDSFDLDNVRSGYVGMSDTITEFPELKTYISRVEARYSGVACFTGKKHSIAFNPNWFGSDSDTKERLENAIKAASASGWWPKNSSPASIMVHECGHALQYMIADAEGVSASTYCQAVVRSAIATVQRNGYGKGKSSQEMRKGISTQASERNTKETVAEAFADCYANGENANPLSIEIRRLLVRDYKKYFPYKD